MATSNTADVTEALAGSGEVSARLVGLGFRWMRQVQADGRAGALYILPPMVEIGAGAFLMGSDRVRDRRAKPGELPQHTLSLNAYEIARYPLTVAEYACFLKANEGVTSTLGWSGPPQPERPAVWLSWHDVQRYARWLSLMMSDERWRLPTEAEWEKAARGSDGRIFPWGNKRDKVLERLNEGGRKRVDLYPHTASPYGMQAMLGNVCEWTSSMGKPYPYAALDGREATDLGEPRVLRGLPWFKYARAAARTLKEPSACFNYLGARLVRAAICR